VLLVAYTAQAQVQTLDPLTVSATRAPEPLSQVPFSVEVIPAEQFSDPFSATVDDALRSSADFSLFRRNDSMTANPTAQGVSLRGLGPSGASRSLVLLDGVPLNDPFGGWIQWSLVPVGSLLRAEIVPGGGATAWGNAALAGVIQLFSLAPRAGDGSATLRLADFGTETADISQAVAAGPGTLVLAGEAFYASGTNLVAPENRGPVDIDAASRHTLASARWNGTLGGALGVVVTLRRYEEWRDNGTAYQQNTLRELFGSVAVSGQAGPDAAWEAVAYAQGQDSSQAFSSVNAARTTETPASLQFEVPSTAVGLEASATLRDDLGGSTTLGGDFRDVDGETREDFLFTKGAYTEQRYAGGRQAFAGLFAERVQSLTPALHATVGVRLDRWDDTDGHLRNVGIANGALLLQTLYPDRSGTEFSPSAGLAWDAAPGLRFHAAAQHAFRQPTLNELYRPFRQGNTTTLANPALSTEHADTGEVGATWTRGAASLSLTGFAARLEDPVANVTLAQGPGTFPLFGALSAGSIGQERLNLGRVDTDGAQLGAAWSPWATLGVNLSVICESATVASAPVAPALVGNALAEVPRWTAALGVRWHPLRALSFSLRARGSGSQFDDDQNLLPLAAYRSVDVSARLVIAAHTECFAGVSNLGNSRIETAHSALGVFNIAPQRIAEAGFRLGW
jgi:outer membrane receptor protein involved in Fe transport